MWSATSTARRTTGGASVRRWSSGRCSKRSGRHDMSETKVRVTVNERARGAFVAPRLTLADFLRERCHLTGTHLGCEHGVCGACTVLLDGEAVRSCLVFAVQAHGREVTTIEGLSSPDGALTPIQSAF